MSSILMVLLFLLLLLILIFLLFLWIHQVTRKHFQENFSQRKW